MARAKSLRPNVKLIEEGYKLILKGLGIDYHNSDHMHETPRRAAKALLYELCSGLVEEPPEMTTFPREGPPNMIISRGIPVRSLCAHHLLPFTGVAAMAYIPQDKLLGLSKLSRIVEWCARRPSVQEEVTNQIAMVMVNILYPGQQYDSLIGGCGVGVIIRARHMCMELRGVNHTSDVVTSALAGEFLNPEVRAEFLSLAGEINGG